MSANSSMTHEERRSILSLAFIYVARLLGIFLLLPVLALYAGQLTGASELSIGLAFGAYGLTQALLQIPFGFLSDKFGRKRLITIGLILFAVGSVVCASAATIQGLIIGRALQGCGAISSVVIALVADLTRISQRAKAMALIGLSIGLSFALSMVLAPILGLHLGVAGLFWLIAFLCICAIVILYTWVPNPPPLKCQAALPLLNKSLLTDGQLMRFDGSIFCCHALLSMLFLVLPRMLQEVGVHIDAHWLVYLPLMAITFLFMLPILFFVEKHGQQKAGILFAIILLGLAQLGFLASHEQLVWLFVSMSAFFLGFNVLEASLPSMLSKIAPPAGKGTVMGIYTTAQFLGIFFGGVVGGWLMQHEGRSALFAAAFALCVLWFIVALGFVFADKGRHAILAEEVR